MAVIDRVTPNPQGSPAGSFAFDHVVNDGQNRGLIVVCDVGSWLDTAGVRAGGVDMLLLGRAGAGLNRAVSAWFLPNPVVGSVHIVVTLTGNASGIFTAYSGADIDPSVLPTFRGNQGSSAAPAVSVPSNVGYLILDHLCGGPYTFTPAAGQSSVENVSNGNRQGCSSTKAGATGNVTMAWSASGSDNWGIVALSLKPASGSPPPAAPGAPSGLQPLRSDGVTPIAVGATEPDTLVFLAGTTSCDPTLTAKLQVEIRPVGTALYGTYTHQGPLAAAGQQILQVSAAAGTGHHWQAPRVANRGGA